MTAGTGLRPDPAAFLIVIDLPESIYRTPPKNPLARGRSVAGWRLAGGGQKNVELVGYSVTFFVVIEVWHLLEKIFLKIKMYI
jgi:hypothetical protein